MNSGGNARERHLGLRRVRQRRGSRTNWPPDGRGTPRRLREHPWPGPLDLPLERGRRESPRGRRDLQDDGRGGGQTHRSHCRSPHLRRSLHRHLADREGAWYLFRLGRGQRSLIRQTVEIEIRRVELGDPLEPLTIENRQLPVLKLDQPPPPELLDGSVG